MKSIDITKKKKKTFLKGLQPYMNILSIQAFLFQFPDCIIKWFPIASVQYLWNAQKSKPLRQQRQVGEANPLFYWVVNGAVAKVNLWEVEVQVWCGHDCVDSELDRLHLKTQRTNMFWKSFAAKIVLVYLISFIWNYYKKPHCFMKNIYLWLRWLCVNFSAKVNMKYYAWLERDGLMPGAESRGMGATAFVHHRSILVRSLAPCQDPATLLCLWRDGIRTWWRMERRVITWKTDQISKLWKMTGTDAIRIFKQLLWVFL